MSLTRQTAAQTKTHTRSRRQSASKGKATANDADSVGTAKRTTRAPRRRPRHVDPLHRQCLAQEVLSDPLHHGRQLQITQLPGVTAERTSCASIAVPDKSTLRTDEDPDKKYSPICMSVNVNIELCNFLAVRTKQSAQALHRRPLDRSPSPHSQAMTARSVACNIPLRAQFLLSPPAHGTSHISLLSSPTSHLPSMFLTCISYGPSLPYTPCTSPCTSPRTPYCATS
jgi:hypothetical protein